MKLSVIGCGYLGTVHAACMAKLGHTVIGVDLDADKIAQLQSGRSPFYEPGLDSLLEQLAPTGRLTFSTDLSEVEAASVHFVCVGTPQQAQSNAADLTSIDAVFRDISRHFGPHPDGPHLVVGKSTVPVGTAQRLASELAAASPAGVESIVAWNPEFLREGFGIEDTLDPDRLVYGVQPGPDGEKAKEILDVVYASQLHNRVPRVVTDFATAEMAKVASNSFLATKISFINAMAELCEASGADVLDLSKVMGLDPRIGNKYLNAGLGFGGGCLPKDIRAFTARAGELGADHATEMLREVDSANLRQRLHMVELAEELLGGTVDGKHIAVLGATFKPNSDDLRDSPSLAVARELLARGADVYITDPRALQNLFRTEPQFKAADTPEDAARGADLLLLGTEWEEYRNLDPRELLPLVGQPLIVDGRNALDAARWRAAGWTYRAYGRPLAAGVSSNYLED